MTAGFAEDTDQGTEGRYVIGVDIGGTFTDACAVAVADGKTFTAKARSTPEDLTRGLVEALHLLSAEVGLRLPDLLQSTVKFAHGTTQTTNVLFTWSGARTGLITTRGFGDEILIMRARGRVAGKSLAERRHLRATDKPPRIVEPELIEEVNERVDFRGRPLVRLTEDEARRAVGALLDKGTESIAVALLWSHENPEHELLIAKVVSEMSPGTYVALSHELAPVVGEYERASTAAVDAYVGPTLVAYLRQLVDILREASLQVPLLVLQGGGGAATADHTVPVNTIESGPAAGMVAAKSVAQSTGLDNVIATDVGGTTFKVGLIVDGEIPMARETIINQYSLLMPMIDVVSIGAGGGSIAWADDTRLRVGPQSAGSDPGPACYGWGGKQPTVTDADLVLGFLNANFFLGGRQKLNRRLAEKAIRERVARPLFDGDVIKAAAGIRRVVDAAMADLVRKATIERGHDPRAFLLYAYGGAGPLHAADYAKDIGVGTIIVPPEATVYSAYGAAASDIQHSAQRSVRPEMLFEESELRKALNSLETQVRGFLDQQGVPTQEVRLTYWADMRYERQLHDVRVPLKMLPDDRLADAFQSAFLSRYGTIYGAGAILTDVNTQLLKLGVEGVGVIAKPPPRRFELRISDSPLVSEGTRDIFWPEADRWIETPIFHGPSVAPGAQIQGPAVIDHPGTTIVIPELGAARVDEVGNTVITLWGG